MRIAAGGYETKKKCSFLKKEPKNFCSFAAARAEATALLSATAPEQKLLFLVLKTEGLPSFLKRLQ